MSAIADYIAALDRAHRRGDATEHSYRPALKALLEARADNIEATNEPHASLATRRTLWCTAARRHSATSNARTSANRWKSC